MVPDPITTEGGSRRSAAGRGTLIATLATTASPRGIDEQRRCPVTIIHPTIAAVAFGTVPPTHLDSEQVLAEDPWRAIPSPGDHHADG